MRFCGLSFGLSPGKLPCIYFDWFLVRGISLSAAQLFVIAIENILRGCVGNLTRGVEDTGTITSLRQESRGTVDIPVTALVREC